MSTSPISHQAAVGSPTSTRSCKVDVEESIRSTALVGYLMSLATSLLVAALSAVVNDEVINLAYCVLFVPLGSWLILRTYKSTATLITPLTLYAAIWMIAVPATSFGAPLMDPMTSREIGVCALAGAAFAFGGLISSASKARPHVQLSPENAKFVANRMTKVAGVLLLVSISSLTLNMALEGRIALFDSSAVDRKSVAQFFAYPVLSSLGTISLAIYARTGTVKRSQLLGSCAFLMLQILTSQRFVAVISMVIVVAILASARRLTRRDLRRIVLLGAVIIAAFSFVALFRGGAEDQQRYFIDTGVYSGDQRSLQYTEVVRYIGMSQRNMSVVLDREYDMGELATFTLSPVTGLLGAPPAGLGTSTYGYTATNIVAYLYADFGVFWPACIIILSALVNSVFRASRRSSSYSSSFAWAISSLGIAISFFAYVHAYVYWAALFPALVYLTEQWALHDARRVGARL